MPRARSGPLDPLARDLPGSATVWLKAGMPQTDLRGASAVKFSMNDHATGPWACAAQCATFPGFRSACCAWLVRCNE